jgi:type IV pilus assembly protein PilN
MARINLLPWREELRGKRQKNFGIAAGVAVVLMAAVVFAVDWQYQEFINFQEGRNKYLTDQTVLLDKKLKSIRELDEQKSSMIARMEIITQLQASRPEVVHLFDELVSTLPEGVYYESIEQNSKVISIAGVAQSNAFVSKLMRNLNASEWLDNATLQEIVSRGQEGNDLLRLAQFRLSVTQKNDNAQPEDEEGENSQDKNG